MGDTPEISATLRARQGVVDPVRWRAAR